MRCVYTTHAMSSHKQRALPEVRHISDNLDQSHTTTAPDVSHTAHLAWRKASLHRNRVNELYSEVFLSQQHIPETAVNLTLESANKSTVEDLEYLFLNHFRTQTVEYGKDSSCMIYSGGRVLRLRQAHARS